MNRLIPAKRFDNKFIIDEHTIEISIFVNKIGVGEFTELRLKYADILKNAKSGDLSKIINAAENNDIDKLAEILSQKSDWIISLKAFSESLILYCLDSIIVNNKKFNSKEDIKNIINQLPQEGWQWVAKIVQEHNKNIFIEQKAIKKKNS